MTKPRKSTVDQSLADERAAAEATIAEALTLISAKRDLIGALDRIAAARGEAAAKGDTKPAAKRGEVEAKVLKVLRDEPLLPRDAAEVAETTHQNIGSVRQALGRLTKAGKITRDGAVYRAATERAAAE